MEKPSFIMESMPTDLFRFWLFALIPSLLVFLLIDHWAGIYLFFLLSLIPSMVKHRTLLVFDDFLIEKNREGRFTKEVNARQIDSFQRTMLGNISLIDSDGGRLLCIKFNMTNRNLFEQWLKSHHIESK